MLTFFLSTPGISSVTVYNLSFSKHGSKVLTNFYKKTTKDENSKEFFELVELIKKGFQEEEKLLKELKKNHPPERKVVSKKEGTANFANIQGNEVGGKTGTALKSINGIYTNKKINTFISYF